MNKKFCPKCNGINYYEDKIPAGCCHCLQPFAGTLVAQITSASPAQEQKPQNRIQARAIEEEQKEESVEIDCSKFDNVEIEYSLPKRQKQTLRALALDEGEKISTFRPKNKPIKSKKGFEKAWSADFEKANRKNSLEIGG